MNPAQLRHRVQIYGNIKSVNELNETKYNDVLLTTVWAAVIPQTGKMQNQQVETILTNVTHRIETRYHKTILEAYQDKQTKSRMFIMFRGQRFDIKYILNPYFKNETLEIFVEEVIG